MDLESTDYLALTSVLIMSLYSTFQRRGRIARDRRLGISNFQIRYADINAKNYLTKETGI